MKHLGFHDVVFDEDFLTATRADGTVVRFTRRERALLSLLATTPGRLFSRDELVDALCSRGTDRNVDFVVNRVRSKLKDTGPQRRFIATQYGEGYVWVATSADAVDQDEFFVIGPLRGLRDAAAEAMLETFRTALQQRCGKGRRVRCAPDLGADAGGAHLFSIEVIVHPTDGCLHAAFLLRHAPSREVVASYRESFPGVAAEPAIDALAAAVFDAAWRHLTLGSSAARTPTDPPLDVRLAAVSAMLDPPGRSWAANGEWIARFRASEPSDPTAAILWAMHLFGRATVDPGPEPLSREAVDALGEEIEGLVLPHLSAVREDPVMALAAAKLLLGVHRGHEDLAESLANAAFAGSAAFAAALPMLAQIKACRGELVEARRLYDESLGLCDAGSTFEVYIQVLKAQTLIALDDRPGADAVFYRLLEIAPAALQEFALLFLPAGDDGLARRLAPLADRMSEGHARRVVAYLHYRVARYFRSPRHAANTMRGPLTHLVRRFGPTVASAEIWAEMPSELHYLRAAPGPAATEAEPNRKRRSGAGNPTA